MADPSLPPAPHSAIEAWIVCRDELALASQHLERARNAGDVVRFDAGRGVETTVHS